MWWCLHLSERTKKNTTKPHPTHCCLILTDISYIPHTLHITSVYKSLHYTQGTLSLHNRKAKISEVVCQSKNIHMVLIGACIFFFPQWLSVGSEHYHVLAWGICCQTVTFTLIYTMQCLLQLWGNEWMGIREPLGSS